MCDERTEAENVDYLARMQLKRREWGIGAGAMVAAFVAGCNAESTSTVPSPAGDVREPNASGAPESAFASPGPDAVSLHGQMVTIPTPDGEAEAFYVTPAEGRHPAVLIWPDVAGLREAFEAMATRLASEGYAVLAVNQYYRSSKLPILETFSQWRTEEGKTKIAPMREAVTADGVTRDGAAFVAWLDARPEVDPDRKIGSSGYCMGGPFTFRTAAASPTRVGAIASFHGGGLVGDAPDSPHALMSSMQAAALVCIAHNDDEREPEAKDVLRRSAETAGLEAEIEVYPAQHGWCVLDSPVYDEEQAERAWTRMLATFDAKL